MADEKKPLDEFDEDIFGNEDSSEELDDLDFEDAEFDEDGFGDDDDLTKGFDEEFDDSENK